MAVFGDGAQPGSAVARADLAGRHPDPPLRTTLSEPAALAAVPGTGDVVVVGTGDDQLVEISAATGRIVRRVTVGLQPDAVAVTPAGTAIVVDGGADAVTPVNLHTGRVGPAVHVGNGPDAIAIGGPGGRLAVVADGGQNLVLPVFTATMHPGFPIRAGSEPDAVAFAPGGTLVLVADLGSDNVTPIDLTTGHPARAIPVGVPPTGIAVTRRPAPGTTAATDPAGTAWVCGGGELVPIDLTTMRAGAPIAVGHAAEDLALTDGGTRAWVADQQNRITEVDLADGKVGPSVVVGGRPRDIVIPAAAAGG